MSQHLLKTFIYFAQLFIFVDMASENQKHEEFDNTMILKYPSFVSVRLNGSHHCAGAIIGNNTVLTAAQCLVNLGTEDNLQIIAGSSSKDGKEGETHEVTSYLSHANYNWRKHTDDIALIKIRDEFHFTPSTQTIVMRPSEYDDPEYPVDRKGTILGFGDGSNLLDENVRIVDLQDCSEDYESMNTAVDILGETLICAGDETTDTDMLDAGGPLIINSQLYGVVSFVVAESHIRSFPPVIFTDISKYWDWIVVNLKKL